jgi:glyoxylase-like metal-dependent hydrolase (beta-lactamase superfamily II)
MAIKIYSVRFGINRCYLIQDQGMIMIDGGPPNKLPAFQKFIRRIAIDPTVIRLIVLTHGDFDHVGSASEIRSLTGAKIAIHENDRAHVEQAIYNFPPGTTVWGKLLHAVLNPALKPVMRFTGATCDIVLTDSDHPLNEYGIKGKIIYTPGHTKGSVSVLLDTGEAFVGCMAHNNIPFRLRPGLPIFAEDIDAIGQSWKKLIEGGAQMIYPAHGSPFPVDVIKNILG